MNTLQKSTLAIVTALGLSMAATTALSGPGDCGGYGHGRGGGWGQKHGDPEQRAQAMQARKQQRMQQLESQLNLNAEQQDAWQFFTAAMEAHHGSMGKGRWRTQEAETGALEHFNNRVQFMEQRLAGMKAVAEAANQLYAALDTEQKVVIDEFFNNRYAWRKGAGKVQ